LRKYETSLPSINIKSKIGLKQPIEEQA